MTDIFTALAAEFPRDAVHWRAQTLTKDGTKALALAYLDARDVMDRLDEVCTPAGWRNSVTETPKGRLIATIEIKVGDEWIGKTDGAGDTAVEGEKGGISDSLKRAAVLWGIGRYLYRMKAVWAPCKSRDTGKEDKWGNKVWQWLEWNGSPWDAVRSAPQTRRPEPVIDDGQYAELIELIRVTETDTKAMLENYKVAAVNQMTVAQFNHARSILINRLPKKEASNG